MESSIENGKLVSNRVLKPGGITENYGLELAAAWGLDSSFMKRAFKLRDGDELLTTKSSRYNKNVYMEYCKMCKSKENLHTHHIREQHTADSNGLIENRFHKNKKFNLLVLCEDCHRKIHEN
jgi:DNA mismatch repair ATPase MutS